MKIVLDASAALAAVIGLPAGPDVLDILAEATVVVAPELFAVEVTSGLWKYVIAKQLTIDEALERLDLVHKLVDRYETIAATAHEVLREAASRRHAVYDLCYAVVARREGAAILTLDKRLKAIATAMGVTALP